MGLFLCKQERRAVEPSERAQQSWARQEHLATCPHEEETGGGV